MKDSELKLSFETLLYLCPFTNANESDFYHIFLDLYKDKLKDFQIENIKKIIAELEEEEKIINELNGEKINLNKSLENVEK